MTSQAQGSADLVVHNADFVITVDKDRRILRNGSVVIKGNSISRVVKADEVTQEELAGRVIDASGKIVTPGFIDTHIHTTKQFNRGLADDVELRDHLLARNFPLRGRHGRGGCLLEFHSLHHRDDPLGHHLLHRRRQPVPRLLGQGHRGDGHPGHHRPHRLGPGFQRPGPHALPACQRLHRGDADHVHPDRGALERQGRWAHPRLVPGAHHLPWLRHPLPRDEAPGRPAQDGHGVPLHAHPWRTAAQPTAPSA